jgi:hypothetical protein
MADDAATLFEYLLVPASLASAGQVEIGVRFTREAT